MAKKRKFSQTEQEEAVDANDANTESKKADESFTSKLSKPKALVSKTTKPTDEESTNVVGEPGTQKKRRRKKNKSNSESQDSIEKTVTTPRFIVFIGNLPYTATKPSVQSHFASVRPIAIRLNTFKDPVRGKIQCKGYGFLEFDSHGTMETCLKNFHHSAFNDGISPERKINVELTAGGGGGKSQARKDKIQHKNERLSNQRQRATQERLGERKERQSQEEEKRRDDIHPSRRQRIK